MINKDRLKLALDALRSGEYEQGKQTLCVVSYSGYRSYCCLGVMTDVAIKNGLEGVVEVQSEFRVGYKFDGVKFIEHSMLPAPVRDWYGFDSESPVVRTHGIDSYYDEEENGDTEEATQLNDYHDWDFDKIAKAFENTFMIEEN